MPHVELGDTRLRPSKVRPGTQCWRWRVVRHAAPAQRNLGEVYFQRRLYVRCMCGEERIVFEKDALLGRSKGCASAACRHRFQPEVEKMIEKALKERLAELVKSREATREARLAQIRELEAEIEAIDEEAASLRRALAVLDGERAEA